MRLQLILLFLLVFGLVSAYGQSDYAGSFENDRGIYALGTGSQGYGAFIESTIYRSMYVKGYSGWYDAYFGGEAGISAASVTNRSGSIQTIAFNIGKKTIEPGDLVAMVGITSSPDNGMPMLAVARVDADNWNGVIGVAKLAVLAETVDPKGDGNHYVDFAPVSGVITSEGYLLIITGGLAPAVKISSLPLVANGKIGDKIGLAINGQMALSSTNNNAIILGRIAGPIDKANATIPMFINID
ncbi:MAG: hypothetical protein IPL46_07535 [Saprospiraceae bacterium]|nr:hypothetical protein [Saprospiraceae bacterium]